MRVFFSKLWANLAVMLFLASATTAYAGCISVDVRKEGNVCKAYVYNGCGVTMRCNVQIVGFTSQGRSYRETGSLLISNGNQRWHGIDGVAACGEANADCQQSN